MQTDYKMQAKTYYHFEYHSPLSGQEFVDMMSYFGYTNAKLKPCTIKAITKSIVKIAKGEITHTRHSKYPFILRVADIHDDFLKYMQDKIPDITTIPDEFLCIGARRDKEFILAERGGYALL